MEDLQKYNAKQLLLIGLLALSISGYEGTKWQQSVILCQIILMLVTLK